LVREAQVDALRVVMVTSALAGEGKTSLCSHLALSLARAGFRTLLIDGDLRRPMLHRLLGTKLSPGLNEVLRGQAEPPDVLQRTRVDNLALIPAGEWDTQTIEALAQGRFADCLAGVRQQYDFIVVDSSPILPVVDPLLLGQHVDAAILSVLRDVSRLPSVYAAYERTAAFGIRVLGAVASGFREGTHDITYQLAMAAQE
jgi:capsular exopolysaccharide synthesis family protein